ncbi:MAG TPA: DUF3052 family protein [Caulifigura sp.]|nr:DUF3052 family protein [Caulifigura sp.]
MGAETEITIREGQSKRTAKVHLDSETLTIAGRPRTAIPLKSVEWATAIDGVLSIHVDGRTIDFVIGNDAAKWQEKILHPPSLMKKLGIKDDHVVVTRRIDDKPLLEELRGAAGSVQSRFGKSPVSVVLVWMKTREQLDELLDLVSHLAEGGFLWVLWSRGGKVVQENDIREAALRVGLVDVKVCKVSEAFSGLKLMRRKK